MSNQNRNSEDGSKLFPVLPRLRGDEKNKVSAFEASGTWVMRGVGELDRLILSLDVGNPDPYYFDTECVPDVWARPLLFQMALFDEAHVLHRRIVGEWRGLLAMLALRDWRGLSLEAEEVALSKTNGQGLLAVMSRVAPHADESLDPKGGWSRLWVLSTRLGVIGMTSPTTLVCTAADYSNLIPAHAWYDGRLLLDPVMVLSMRERSALAQWVQVVKKGLTEVKAEIDPLDGRDEKSEDDRWNKLIERLQKFEEALGPTGDRGVSFKSPAYFYGENVPRLFAAFDRRLEANAAGSDVIVQARLRDGSAADLLLVDRSIPGQLGQNSAEIRVWGNATLASVLNMTLGGARDRLGDLQLPTGYRLCLPEDLFTKKLHFLYQENALHLTNTLGITGAQASWRGNLVSILPPLQRSILAYLSPTELASRVTIESAGGGFRVTLRLPLFTSEQIAQYVVECQEAAKEEGRNKPNPPTPADVSVSRLYETDDLCGIYSLPVVEVWPNFVTPDTWKLYYTYVNLGGQDTFSATPIARGKDTRSSVIPDPDPQIPQVITRTNGHPEGLECHYKGEPAGLILLNFKKGKPPKETWTIGIDFGTTGTNVWYTISNPGADSDAKGLTFEARLLQVTQNSTLRTTVYDYFLPAEQKETPFLSLFRDLDGVDISDPLVPILEGHIHFLHPGLESPGIDGKVKTDLKWSPTFEMRLRTRAFLEQLCLQCAAEASAANARKVAWRFSYPTSFSVRDRGDFQTMWNHVTASCATLTGLEVDGEVKSEAESVVAPRFFSSAMGGVKLGEGTVCVDIGGGTSDVSVWNANKLIWHTSVRLAGRDIFLDMLRIQPEILKTLGVKSETVENLKKNRDSTTLFYAQVDALIMQYGEQWLRILTGHTGEPAIRRLQSLMAFGLSGLAFYLGSLVAFLAAEGSYDAKHGLPQVLIGGNGSRMFQWIGLDRKGKGPLEDLLTASLLRASSLPLKVGNIFTISSKPKAEAAFGLVRDETRLDVPKTIPGTRGRGEVLAGEDFRQRGGAKAWSDVITAEEFCDGVDVVDNQRFRQFAEVFDEFAGRTQLFEKVSLTQTDLGSLRTAVRADLAQLKGQDVDSVRIEPLFILGLRHFLQIKGSEWLGHP